MDPLLTLFQLGDVLSVDALRRVLQGKGRHTGLDLTIRFLLASCTQQAVKVALDVASKFDDPTDRAIAYLRCAEVPGAHSTKAFGDALRAANEIEDEEIRDAVLDYWRNAMGRVRTKVGGPADDLLSVTRAGPLQGSTNWLTRRFLKQSARVRGGFLGRAPGELIQTIVPEALSIAKGLESDWGRANAIAGLSPYLSDNQTSDAWQFTDSLKQAAPRARARASIASRLANVDNTSASAAFLQALSDVGMVGPIRERANELVYLCRRAAESNTQADEIVEQSKAIADRLGEAARDKVMRLMQTPGQGGASFAVAAHKPRRAAQAIRQDTQGRAPSPPLSINLQELSQNLEELEPLHKEVDRTDLTTNIGLADTKTPQTTLPPREEISVAKDYLLLVDIGAQRAGRIAVGPAPSEELVPERSEIAVVLYSNDPELRLNGPTFGRLRAAHRHFLVSKKAAKPRGVPLHELAETLYFSMTVLGESERLSHLRLSFFHKGVLVQSREITLRIGSTADGPNIEAVMDFQLAQNLRPQTLKNFGPHDLCLMMNDADDGSHGFHFFADGSHVISKSSNIDSFAVQNMTANIRHRLRIVSWGDKSEWNPKDHKYLYASPRRAPGFLKDIAHLAIAGKAHLDAIAQQLAGEEQSELRKKMRTPGRIQLGLKHPKRAVIPVGLFYDFPLDIGKDPRSFSLCNRFVRDSIYKDRFKESPCFQGDCPSYDNETVVCPAGFWGYRHEIGVPMSLAKLRDDHPNTAGWVGTRQNNEKFLVAYYTGQDFALRERHIASLERKFEDSIVSADSRDAAITQMTGQSLGLVYFYCHGGLLQDQFPYIHVGPENDDKFLRATISDKGIRWTSPRPVVFVNGCHTTQVEPEKAVEMVSGFLEAGASAVTGTEITIFESLAVKFANTFMGLFLVKEQTFGAAIRGARLGLLQDLNPLGLVYIPFGLSSLQLHRD